VGFIILRVALELRSSMIDLAFVLSGLPYWVYGKSASGVRRAPTNA
jgi:hypothetical protein